jgi:hypothetical protein
MMRIEDYDSVCDVLSSQDIEAALSRRHPDGMNSFWLSHGTEEFPYINILANGDLAYVHYFPREGHPGFASVAKGPVDKPRDTSVFFLYPTEKVWILNGAVVPFSDALKAAQEFAISSTMPKCIRWDSLVEGE